MTGGVKCAREVMEILEAYDLTRCAHSAARLVGCDEKTVTRYVAVRDAGCDVGEGERRSRMIDPFLSKIEELVEASQGRIRADVVHEKLTAMGFSGTDRTTRRAVAEAKTAYRDEHPVPGVPDGVGPIGAEHLQDRGLGAVLAVEPH